MDKIKITRTINADTRTPEGTIKKESLEKETREHIQHVEAVGKFLSSRILFRFQHHDHTKLDYLDSFHTDFVKEQKHKANGGEGSIFKNGFWWKQHLNERHHLNDRVPTDVDLIDVLEMISDCVVAGKARSGEVYPIEISEEIIRLAIENTVQMLIYNIEVENGGTE